MFPQGYFQPEFLAGAMNEAFDIVTDPPTAATFTDPLTMGDAAYDYLNYGMQGDPAPQFSDWLGYPLVQDNTWSMGNPPPDYNIAGQSAPEFAMPSPSGFPSHFPLTPSPPPPQHPPLPPHEPSCRQASPFERAKGQWACDACGKDFRGRWECKRHIENAGRRVVCLACNKEINGREDSMRRHYYKHCKRMDLGRDSANLRFDDAFINV